MSCKISENLYLLDFSFRSKVIILCLWLGVCLFASSKTLLAQTEIEQEVFTLESPYTNGFQKLQLDREGNCYVSGYFREVLQWENHRLEDSQGGYFVAKIDAARHLKWILQLNAPVRDLLVVQDRLYLLGHFQRQLLLARDTLQSQGGFDAYLSEHSTDTGALVWKKQFTAKKDLLAQSLSSEGKYLYVLGHFESDFQSDAVSFAPFYFKNAYLMQVSLEGTTRWGKTLSGGHNALTGVYARKVEADTLGNVYVGGSVSGYADFGGATLRSSTEHFYGEGLVYNHDIFLARYQSQNGEIVWAKRLAQYADLQDLKSDGKGSIYLTGSFKGNTNSTQSSELGAAWFGNTKLQAQLLDNGSPSEDGFLMKISSLGNYIWLKHLQSSYESRGIAIAIDYVLDCVYLAGVFEASLQINQNEWNIQAPTDHKQDVYWVGFAGNGSCLGGDLYGGVASEQLNTVLVKPDGKLVMSGRLSSETNRGTYTATRNNAFLLEMTKETP